MMEYVTLTGLIALAASLYYARFLKSQKVKNENVHTLSRMIKNGAKAYLRRQYTTLVVFVVVVAALLYVFVHPYTSCAFILGAILSASVGYIGMIMATSANSRTVEAAEKSLADGLNVAFASGAIVGLGVVSFALLGLTFSYYFLDFVFAGDLAMISQIIVGFGFGASSIALFARVGGGIYTKAADVGADLVGKVEAGIPEDDPRNPATIADNVGDNVGDVAGMSADLFESYTGSIIAAAALGTAALGSIGFKIPFVIASLGVIASIIATKYVRISRRSEKIARIMTAMRNATLIASGITLVLVFVAFQLIIPENAMQLFTPVLLGILSGATIGLSTEHYTSDKYQKTRDIADASLTGAATNIISGLAIGMISTAIPIISICITTLAAYYFAGLYGIALAAVGMLSTLGITLANDAYGPVADNAGGIAEMTKMKKIVRERTDTLDAMGNTTAAIGKGFAIGSAALTTLALIATYMQAASLNAAQMSLANPSVLVGVFVGGMLPFLFSALTMLGVSKAAKDMVTEVRRQFKNKKIMSGEARPDYEKCVDISTIAAQREMVPPAIMAVVSPVAFGFVFGPAALAGMLVGATATGFLLAVNMSNAGGAWDNAKKLIESGMHGGKGSEAHKAAVVGDTVGDPFKDTSGPSINILLKLMSIVSLVFAPLMAAYSLL